MAIIPSKYVTKYRRHGAIALLAGLASICAFLPLAARQISRPSAFAEKPGDPQGGAMTVGTQTSTLGPPSIPVDEIIKKFAAQEAAFKIERDNFTYTQTFVLQTLDDTNHVDGEYRQTSDIVFDPSGKRTEVITYAPAPTLTRLELTQEDFNDLENVYPFVLTSDQVPKYDIKYVDHEQVDELTCYVFDVAPKSMEKNLRYFQGRIWVEDKDFQIVKTFGKPVGYTKKRNGQDQAFPDFETFRENIEGKFWFPTYTRANEMLHFKNADSVHIRLTVKYENYKRFGVTVKIGAPVKTVPPPDPEKK